MRKEECLSNKIYPALKENIHMFKISYSGVVVSQMYLTMITQPNICYVVEMVNRCQSNLRSDIEKLLIESYIIYMALKTLVCIIMMKV